jgi:hypothetical protein
MANTIKIKNSNVASNTPAALESGELAINFTDRKLFYKDNTNTIVGSKLITSISGTTDQVTVSESSGAFTISLPSTVKVTTFFVDNIEIDTTGALTNQALVYNGTKFAPANVSGGGGSVDDLAIVLTSQVFG